MSQNTRCPACQTLFKVVPDQLRVSEGWVRCGQCSEIFDAHLHLYKEPFAPDPVQYGAAVQPNPMGAVDLQATEQARLPGQHELKVDSGADTGRMALAAPHGFNAPAAVAPPNQATGNGPEEPPPTQVSFLRDVKGTSVWQKTWVRTCLVLTGVCLLSALVLQVAVHQRDRLAATLPAARPALAALCQVLNCRISPLRQIESVVIDGSTFTELRGNVYRLGFTIKNTAPIDLAMPALELTLTDSQDRAALRRVFLPAEFGATSTVLAAGAEWAGTLAVGVRTNGNPERIAGYRILTLYP